MSPSSSTTATSQRPLKFSSRSPPATQGPRTCMTRRSVTTPSAERSLELSSSSSVRENPGRDSSWYDGEANNDFGSISSNFVYRHHVELRVKLYSPREESFPIPLKYIDVSRTTHTNLDVLQKAASMTIGISMDQEICLIHGQISLNLLHRKRNLQKDICGPGGDWQNGKRHPGQIIYGQNSGRKWRKEWCWNSQKADIQFSLLQVLCPQVDWKAKAMENCRYTVAPIVNFGDLITADHKVLSDNCESRNHHRYAVVVQDLATQWIQAYPCKKNKTSQETQKSLQKFLEPERKPKVIYADNSLEFGKACEDLSWNHCTSTPHRSETNGIAERAVRRVEETSAVLLQSGLNKKWWADSMECHCYLRNIQDLSSEGEITIWKAVQNAI